MFSTLKAIMQQLILINERLEKWEQTYIAYQEMRRVGSMPVYKKKEEKQMPRFCEHCDTCVCDFCWHCQKEWDDDGAATGLGYCHSHMEFMSLGSGSGCDDFDCFNNHKGEDRPWMKKEARE
jgi:hypothetical protein